MSILKEMTLEEGMSMKLDTTFNAVKKKFDKAGTPPALSTQNVKFHLDTLTKGYFDKFEETGSPFAYCGAKLHTIWWDQFGEDKGSSEGVVELLGYDSVDNLVEAVQNAADTIQGNGWVVVTKEALVPITNHSYAAFDDIIMLIDLWEHAYQVDYKSDKKTYITKLLNEAISWKKIKRRM